ncbi:MAG: serine/threonine protein kinase [Burkholderiales bacterium]|nr:serine/threonine protein kinase [Burkholderiales bacterium]
MSANPAAAYLELTPARVLDALDALGLRPDGRLLQLNSYENRVHQVMLEDGRAVVTKFYRPGRWSDAQILEEHAFALELADAEVPVAAPMPLHARADPALRLLGQPPTLAHWHVDGVLHRFSVTPRRAGREPELERTGTLQRLGGFIGRLHAVGRRAAFSQRLHMDPARDAAAAIDAILGLDRLTTNEAAPWLAAARSAQQSLSEAFERHGPLRQLRLHGDCHLGNILWRDADVDGGPQLVDLDDACMGPAVQDLWMLVSGDAATMDAQFAELLQGYLPWCDFDVRERQLIEPLRTLRMLRHSAWLAQRWADPAFPAAFAFFGTPAYWSQQTTQLREQLELMRG